MLSHPSTKRIDCGTTHYNGQELLTWSHTHAASRGKMGEKQAHTSTSSSARMPWYPTEGDIAQGECELSVTPRAVLAKKTVRFSLVGGVQKYHPMTPRFFLFCVFFSAGERRRTREG